MPMAVSRASNGRVLFALATAGALLLPRRRSRHCLSVILLASGEEGLQTSLCPCNCFKKRSTSQRRGELSNAHVRRVRTHRQLFFFFFALALFFYPLPLFCSVLPVSLLLFLSLFFYRSLNAPLPREKQKTTTHSKMQPPTTTAASSPRPEEARPLPPPQQQQQQPPPPPPPPSPPPTALPLLPSPSSSRPRPLPRWPPSSSSTRPWPLPTTRRKKKRGTPRPT